MFRLTEPPVRPWWHSLRGERSSTDQLIRAYLMKRMRIGEKAETATLRDFMGRIGCQPISLHGHGGQYVLRSGGWQIEYPKCIDLDHVYRESMPSIRISLLSASR